MVEMQASIGVELIPAKYGGLDIRSWNKSHRMNSKMKERFLFQNAREAVYLRRIPVEEQEK